MKSTSLHIVLEINPLDRLSLSARRRRGRETDVIVLSTDIALLFFAREGWADEMDIEARAVMRKDKADP